MAVFNGERFLRESIDSILEQSFADFEFLIIDDGSTDKTRRIISSYTDPRIRLVVNEQNFGLTPSLNRGLRLARGEFVARQDADDISEPERFTRQLEYLRAHPEVALLGTQYRYMDEEGATWETEPLPCLSPELGWALLFGTAVIHTSVILRREPVLSVVGFYDERIVNAQDYDYWYRISTKFPIATLDQALVRYRCHGSSITSRSPTGRMPTLRASHHARLLGWDEQAGRHIRARSEMMAALMGGWADALDSEVVAGAADDILELLEAYLLEREFSDEEAHRHSEGVKQQVAEHLALVAASHGRRDPCAAMRLWRQAHKISPPVVLAPRTLRRSFGRAAASFGWHIRRPTKASPQ